MSALEETYWHAKCADTPLPTQQIVMHLAQVAQRIWNANITKQKDWRPLNDFLLFRKKTTDQESIDQRIRTAFGIFKKDK